MELAPDRRPTDAEDPVAFLTFRWMSFTRPPPPAAALLYYLDGKDFLYASKAITSCMALALLLAAD